MKFICQTNDPVQAQLIKVASLFPEAVKEAESADVGDADYFENLPDTCFAMPETRQFPINNREQTLLSIGYSKLASKVPEYVLDSLEKAAQIYDIDTSSMFKFATAEIEAVDEKYLLPEIKRFKVASATDVPEVEKAFLEFYTKMSTEQRVEAGTNLVKFAEDYSVPLAPGTHKLAGFTLTSTQVLVDWTEARKAAAEKLGSAVAQAYTKVAENLRKLPGYLNNRTDQLALVDMFLDMDKTAGVNAFYGTHIPDPFRTVFNTDKPANSFIKVAGVLANKQLLAQLPLDFWTDLLGDTGAAEIAPGGVINPEALAQVVTTLPEDLKVIVEKQLSAYSK
jgi:hypothetical protein